MQLDKYIFDLLFYHDCVIVPNFGAFISNYEPARIDNSRRIILPPSKKIAFNPSLTDNDALLIHHISKTENLSYADISQELTKTINEWNSELVKGEKIVLRNIGVLAYNSDKKIIFNRLNIKNYLLDSFGLSEVNIKTIRRQAIATERQYKKTSAVKETRNKLYYTIPLSVTFFLALWAFLFINSPVSQFDKSGLNFLFNKTKVSDIDSEEIRLEDKIIRPEAPVEETDESDYSSTMETPVDKVEEEFEGEYYYIIGGAFKHSENASSYQQGLLIKNYSSEVVLSNKELFLVTYSKFRSKTNALNFLKGIKENENSQVWILKQ